MKVIAKRGVCIGVNKHLKPGETAELDGQTVTFLVGIGAVELVQPEPEAKTQETDEKITDKKKKPTPDEPGKKEK